MNLPSDQPKEPGSLKRLLLRIFSVEAFSYLTCISVALLFLNLGLAETIGTQPWLLGLMGLCWLGCISWTVAAWLQSSSKLIREDRPCWRTFPLLVTVVVLLLAWRGAPTENLMGVQDEAYNLATAMALIRNGTPTVAAPDPMPDGAWTSERPTQAQRAKNADSIGKRRAAYGFLFYDQNGRLRSVFPTGFPLLMAGFGVLFGESAIFWSNTLLLIGAAAAGGRLAANNGGSLAGWGAGMLILCCPLHLWISRTAFAEPMLSFIFLSALLQLVNRGSSPTKTSVIGAVMLLASALPLVKFEGWLATGAIFAGLFVSARNQKERMRIGIIGGAGALLLLALLTRSGSSYMVDTLASLTKVFAYKVRLVALTSVFSLILIGVGWTLRKSFSRRDILCLEAEKFGQVAEWTFPRVLAVILALSALVFFLWIRPALTHGDTFYYWPLERDILSWREHTLARLTWYLSTPGLILGFFGICALTLRRNAGVVAPVLAAVFFITFFFLAWDIRNNPVQPYAMRRFVGYATPLLCIGLAIWPLYLPHLQRSWTKILQLTTVLASAAIFIWLAHPILVNHERTGIFSELQRLDRTLKSLETAPIYIQASGHAHRLIIPLQLGMGHYVVPRAPEEDWQEARLEIADTSEKQSIRSPLLITDASAIAENEYEEFRFRLNSRYNFTETFLRQSSETRPKGAITRAFSIDLIQIEPVPLIQAITDPIYAPPLPRIGRTPRRSQP